ncbi:MAG: lamin tail domain-containing protein, partial [Planctomycetales bacterium]|nr:lamin tail domain-containing protein [Planctomycetales bacterium]
MKRLRFEQLEDRMVLDSTVVFSELMYNPGPQSDLEWVELYNEMAVDMDISNWHFDGIDFTFPPGTIVPAQQFVVIAKLPDLFAQRYGMASNFGPYSGRLSNGGETIRLINNNERVMDEINYNDVAPWPVAPDGSGASLVKANLDGGSDDPTNWIHSHNVGGSPGTTEPTDVADHSAVLFSEIGGRDDAFFFEVTNLGADTVDLAEYTIGTDAMDRTVQLSGLLPPNEYAAFQPADLQIDPTTADNFFLYSNESTHVEDAVRTSDNAQARLFNGEFSHRWLQPNATTPGKVNDVSLETDVVINEIFYHAPGTAVDAQPATFDTSLLLPIDENTTWRYRSSSDGLPQDWASESHPTGQDNWQDGNGLFGYERTDLGIPIRTEFPNPATVFPPITTYYFETDFQIDEGHLSNGAGIGLRHMIDDGAVFFINGQEFLRFNMPDGEIDSGTFASSVPDAALSEVTPIPVDMLRVGDNRLSVEVHQASVASNDIVFGAELLQTRQLTEAIPGQPYTESEEEWIEIFNRSQNRTIDLSNWQFDDGIEFTFPTGTMIGPGEYKLITNDANMLAQAYPTLASSIVGSFTGGLSNQGETIRLVDADGNPADEVRYYDGGRWHEYADGGGASLELISPFADNRSPEAWASSAEIAKSKWQTITYEGVVKPDGFSGNVSQRYHEFILGLLDAGELLIDDVSVLENGVGGIERIQNGTFEEDPLGGAAAKWRIAGNHSGIVVLDPDDPSNQVLRLTTTGALEDRYNHAETTFAGGAQIREGTNYRISLRVRWINGSNQLNTHLYFDRLMRTTRVIRPEMHGTPGAVNSAYRANIGPTFENFRHSPTLPDPDQEVTVYVDADDVDSVANVTLFYAIDDGDFTAVLMDKGDGTYAGVIPGQASGTVVTFYVQGEDALGAASRFPAEGPNARALYQVPNQSDRDGIHNFRIIMRPGESRWLHDRTNVLSNGRIGATVVYNESEVFYDVGVRLKGSNAGRSDASYLGFNLQFDPMRLFRGVHDSVAIDRSGRSSSTPLTQDEILIKHIGNAAGGIPYMYDDLVHVIAPRRAHTRSALLMMSRYGDEFLDTQFENGSEGTVFKLDITYVPNGTAVRNDPESAKIASPYSHPQPTRDLEDLGDDKEAYRSHLLIRNNRAQDDYSRIIEASKVLDQRGQDFVTNAAEVIDLDQWARVFALQSLTGAADVYTRGSLHHNIEFYVRPSDNRILALPWDWDFAFTASARQSLVGTTGNGGRLMNQPGVRRLYHGHLLDIINTTFNNEYLDRWIDHYGEVANQNLSRIKSYVQQRREFVLGRLPDKIEFEIKTNDGVNFETELHNTIIAGEGWIDVREIRAGTNVLVVRWLDDTRWEVDLPIEFGENNIELIAYDHQGNAVGSDTIAIIGTRLLGDLNSNTVLDVEDIDLLAAAIRTGDIDTADLNEDGVADQADHAFLIQERFKTNYGDANLDGVFNSTDLVAIFQAAEYEDAVPGNSTWAEGDWNGDG